jgi:antirestriction protein ArdC
MKTNIYQIVTDKVIAQLENGIVPWQRPWGGNPAYAINYISRKPYSLLNQVLLGERQGEYLTFKQVKSLGGNIKKGAKSSFVVFYSQVPIKDENNEEKGTFPMLRYYNVYHIDDCDGIQSKYAENTRAHNDPIHSAEDIISSYVGREKTLKFINDKPSDKAYYSPCEDLVRVPMIEQYTEVGEYYSTAFHELTHSTMIGSRCDRKSAEQISLFGSQDYSQEELVAEMGAAMLCNIAGINTEKVFKNSVNYIGSWLKKLKNDNRFIIRASSQAEKAVKYITNQKEEQ